MQNKIISCYLSNNQLGFYLDSVRLCNSINYVLPMNEMQKLIVEKVFYSPSKIPNFNCDQIED